MSALLLHPPYKTVSFSSLGIDLENIVYYKDSTHYFVMTAKKQSLLEKGVIIEVGIEMVICLSFMFNFIIYKSNEKMLCAMLCSL